MQMYSALARAAADNATAIQWNDLFAWIPVGDEIDSIFMW